MILPVRLGGTMNFRTVSMALFLAGCATAPALVPANDEAAPTGREVETVADSTRKCANGEPPRLLNSETLERLARAEISRAREYRLLPERRPVLIDTKVHAFVDETGSVLRTIVSVSSNVDFWDRAARRVVGRARFRPAKCRGSPVDIWIELPVTFFQR